MEHMMPGLALLPLLALCLQPLDCLSKEPDQAPVHPERPYVFIVNTVKYGVFNNYLHRYIDRPLFFDRTLRPNPEAYEQFPFASFSRNTEIAKTYGVDGWDFYVVTKSYLDRTLACIGHMDRPDAPEFKYIVSLSGDTVAKPDELLAYMSSALKAALNSKSAYRLGGKIAVATYMADKLPPQRWKELLEKLRKEHGDRFLFIGDFQSSWWQYVREGNNTGSISEKTKKKITGVIRSMLDVFDGIQFSGINHVESDGSSEINIKFYKDVIIGLYKEILAEPAYKDKLLGLNASIGYTCHFSGSTQDEDGTRHLRSTFEASMDANPDFIILNEWSEVYENTFIQPTVYNSLSAQRIIKYYMNLLKGQPPSPNPGDNLEIPNLVVSYRRFLALGEPLKIELLNIPDSAKAAKCSVALELKDLTGKTVRSFPEQSFDTSLMQDKSFTVPTEELADYPALVPSLKIVNASGKSVSFDDGLLYISISPSAAWNRQWAKQPLRDICVPSKAKLQVTPTQNGVTAKGEIETAEDISSLEVLEDQDELWAYDPSDEYGLEENVALYLTWTRMEPAFLSGTMAVKNASCQFKPWLGTDNLLVPNADYVMEGKALRFKGCKANLNQRACCILIPKKEADDAVISIDLNLCKTEIPVKSILKNGVYAETFDKAFMLRFERLDKSPDIPLPLGRRKIEFSASLRPESPQGVIHMRAITKSGKVYNGRPLSLAASGDIRKTAIDVPSETAKAAAKVLVDALRIPDLRYEFDPANGSILYTPAGRAFCGELGGGTDYCWPFHKVPFYDTRSAYPAGLARTAPAYVVEDGANCLKFDGTGNYIAFSQKALPPQRCFTLQFELKPLSAKNQILFKHHANWYDFMTLSIKDGKLFASCQDKRYEPHSVQTGLPVPPNEWSKVEVVYDLKNLIFKVNGKESAPVAIAGWSAPVVVFGYCEFGGYGGDKAEYFDGLLKSFRISHNAEK